MFSGINNSKPSDKISAQETQATQEKQKAKAEKSRAQDAAHSLGEDVMEVGSHAKRSIGQALHAGLHGAQHHAAIAGHRVTVQSPYSLISPLKGVAVAAVLAGAGYVAPRITTASYALTLTVPGVAYTVAALLLAAAVWSFFANIFTKPTVSSNVNEIDVPSDILSLNNEKARLQKLLAQVDAKLGELKDEHIKEGQKVQKKGEAIEKQGQVEAEASEAA